MISQNNPPLKKAVAVLMDLSEDESIRMLEEKEIQYEYDWEDRLWGARQEGLKLGRAEGEKLGEKRGIQLGEKRGEKRGIQLGEKRGEKLRSIAIARKALAEGASVSFISSITGLSEAEIVDLR